MFRKQILVLLIVRQIVCESNLKLFYDIYDEQCLDFNEQVLNVFDSRTIDLELVPYADPVLDRLNSAANLTDCNGYSEQITFAKVHSCVVNQTWLSADYELEIVNCLMDERMVRQQSDAMRALHVCTENEFVFVVIRNCVLDCRFRNERVAWLENYYSIYQYPMIVYNDRPLKRDRDFYIDDFKSFYYSYIDTDTYFTKSTIDRFMRRLNNRFHIVYILIFSLVLYLIGLLVLIYFKSGLFR